MPDRNEAGLILVVDDDPTFVHLVTGLLEREGHEVVQAGDAESALSAIDERRPDLVVLDIEMPGMSGLELLNRLPAGPRVPVIVVSGREAESERVLALDLGADDYVVKPFLAREFAARVRAALRRARIAPSTTYSFSDIEIRLASREVTVGGKTVALTPREFDVLVYLASRAGQVVSRRQLLEEVWQSSEEWQDPATVTEHIRRLRRKIEPDPSQPRRIRGIRKVGYSFDPR
ncbi:MAG TPA: response regulator transcription factor [Acidimicrobiales bacterium]|nr:response regulator transcription factor [Acidimicrobiales bacterium]